MYKSRYLENGSEYCTHIYRYIRRMFIEIS